MSGKSIMSVKSNWYNELVTDLKELVFEGIVTTKHDIGKRILEDDLKFEKPDYGSKKIENLANDLNVDSRDLYRCIQFARKYPEIPESVTRDKIPWRTIINEYLPEHKEKDVDSTPIDEDICQTDLTSNTELSLEPRSGVKHNFCYETICKEFVDKTDEYTYPTFENWNRILKLEKVYTKKIIQYHQDNPSSSYALRFDLSAFDLDTVCVKGAWLIKHDIVIALCEWVPEITKHWDSYISDEVKHMSHPIEKKSAEKLFDRTYKELREGIEKIQKKLDIRKEHPLYVWFYVLSYQILILYWENIVKLCEDKIVELEASK